MAHAYLFRRKLGCPLPDFDGSAGHIGWAFELPGSEGICCGATENCDAHPWVIAGGDNSAWQAIVGTVAELEQKMRKLKYDDYKIVEVARPDTKQALVVSASNAKIGYSFTGNNCLDHAYQVLVHYGALDLPLPTFYPLPNAWFSTATGEHHLL